MSDSIGDAQLLNDNASLATRSLTPEDTLASLFRFGAARSARHDRVRARHAAGLPPEIGFVFHVTMGLVNGAGVEMIRGVSGRLDDSPPEGGMVEFLQVDGLSLDDVAPEVLLEGSSAG